MTDISGSAASETLTGTAGADTIYGLGGDDTLLGLGGDDALSGGDGNDQVDGGDGVDRAYGGRGSDTVRGGAGSDWMYAGGGANEASSSDDKTSVNFLYGDDGDDTIYGGEGLDTLEGGAGDDLLGAGASFLGTVGDILRGGDGNDTLYGRQATLDGGAGADRLTIRTGSTLTGGAGADTFWTSNSVFERDGYWVEDGVSVITDYSAAQGDRLSLDDPNAYRDTRLVFRGALDNANFSLVVGQAYSGDGLGVGFTQIWTWSNGGATYLFVDFDSDGLLSGRDAVVKLLGDVKLTAADFDQAYFTGVMGASAKDVFNGAETADLYFAAGGADEIHGAGGDDILYGNMGDDSMFGDAGADRLYGGEGADAINGGAGDDYIYGGLGGDTIHGGDGRDIIYANATGYDIGTEAAGTVNILYGDAGDDDIIGVSASDQLHGGDGADSIRGAGEIWGDAGGDYLSGSDDSRAGPVIIHGGDGNDMIGAGNGGADAVLWGDAGWDHIVGGFGNDTLNVELGDSYANGGWGNDKILIGGLRAGDAPSLNIAYGDYGDDVFVPLEALTAIDSITLSGGEGSDTVDLSHATGAVTADLTKTAAQLTGMGAIKFEGVENLIAGAFGSTLTGDANVNALTGGAGVDTLSGGGGRDVFRGGGGDDVIDGGDGVDIAYFSGKWSDYTLTASAGTWTIKDNRAGSPDGQDVLRNVEFARFADRVVTNGFNVGATVDTAFASILRADAKTAMLSNSTADLVIKLAAGATDAEVVSTLVQTADATTSVAAMAYQFFTGKIPTASGFDYLVAPDGPNPDNLNSAYYQLFNLENRYINFAVNLGKMGEGKDAFAAKYGGLTLFEATRQAYKAIFGGAPSDEKVHALIDTRVDYFASYGGDGANGVGTKAAMVGWLLAEAQKSDIGVMSHAVNVWLADIADGSAPYAIDVLDPTKSYYNAGWLYDGSQ